VDECGASARVWRLAFGVWRLAFGVWRLAFGVWRLAFGVGGWACSSAHGVGESEVACGRHLGPGRRARAPPRVSGGRRCAPTPLRFSRPGPRRRTRFVRCAHCAQTSGAESVDDALLRRAGPGSCDARRPLTRGGARARQPWQTQGGARSGDHPGTNDAMARGRLRTTGAPDPLDLVARPWRTLRERSPILGCNTWIIARIRGLGV
jgi:hypothetical protein